MRNEAIKQVCLIYILLNSIQNNIFSNGAIQTLDYYTEKPNNLVANTLTAILHFAQSNLDIYVPFLFAANVETASTLSE